MAKFLRNTIVIGPGTLVAGTLIPPEEEATIVAAGGSLVDDATNGVAALVELAQAARAKGQSSQAEQLMVGTANPANTASGNTPPSAPLGSVQFNDAGAFGGVPVGADDQALTIISGVLGWRDPNQLLSFTVAALPTATAGRMIYVTDDVGGATVAVGDGAAFRRTSDRAVVTT